MFILDTDHLSIIERHTGDEYNRVVERIKQNNPSHVFVSVVSMHEQFLGWHNAIAQRKSELDRVEPYRRLAVLFSGYYKSSILHYTEAAAREFDRLRGERVRINTMDLRIAAIAIVNQMTIVSRNGVDFERVPNLKIEDWTTKQI